MYNRLFQVNIKISQIRHLRGSVLFLFALWQSWNSDIEENHITIFDTQV